MAKHAVQAVLAFFTLMLVCTQHDETDHLLMLDFHGLLFIAGLAIVSLTYNVTLFLTED